MESTANQLQLKRLGIDTQEEFILFLRHDCPVVRSEGFESQTRVSVRKNEHKIVASLNIIHSKILQAGEASLSESAWEALRAHEGEVVTVSHLPPMESFSYVRGKFYGNRFSKSAFQQIVQDIKAGKYSKVHLASFVSACAGDHMDLEEITWLTEAMVEAGERMDWGRDNIVDKHCVGGLPGNRTTPIVVSIVAAAGLTIPKTSSRAITSPAGTADTMEVFCNVELSLDRMREIVEKEGACLAWGGAIDLSPADDVIISVERPLNIDSQGQMIASILSKKKSAGSTHLLLDIPVGPTAKVRRMEVAASLRREFEYVAKEIGLHIEVVISNGEQPVGRGVGPALEARDILAVLENHEDAPPDLREHSLQLAGRALEFADNVKGGEGYGVAREILRSGRALQKFQAIIEAQGRRDGPLSLGEYTFEIKSDCNGRVKRLDNFAIARLAKLAGAPLSRGAGVEVLRKLGDEVKQGEPLLRVYSGTPAESALAEDYVSTEKTIIYCA